MKPDNPAFRKRNQIDRAGRTMFIWIAIASVLIGVAVVVSIFLFQKLTYNEKVLAEKQKTASTLTSNLAVVEELKTDIKALEANSALLSVRANENDQALQVVLDALPAEANSLALGASLQNRLLTGIEGNFTLESLQVTPIMGADFDADSTTVDAAETSLEDTKIAFSFSVRGDQAALRQVLTNLERSIRTIIVTNMSVETQGDLISMSIEGHAFFQPARNIELIEKTVQNK